MKNWLSYSLFLSVLVAGCATLAGSADQSMAVKTLDLDGTEVVGAVCELSNSRGTWSVTTPGSVVIHRSNDDIKVVCNKSGYVTGKTAIGSKVRSSLMFWSIFWAGGIGEAVDERNGSAYQYRDAVEVLITAAPNRP